MRYPDHDETYFRARRPDTASPLAAGDDSRRTAAIAPDGLLSRSILPTAAAEIVTRAWVTGDWWSGRVEVEEPSAIEPSRVRAGALVIVEEQILLINCTGHDFFEIPGGGVEPGESVDDAVRRELREETGLVADRLRSVAEVYKDGRREHYFVVDVSGDVSAGLDLPDKDEPRWVPVGSLPDLPVLPKRLAWRIARWHQEGWPEHPVAIADSVTYESRRSACSW